MSFGIGGVLPFLPRNSEPYVIAGPGNAERPEASGRECGIMRIWTTFKKGFLVVNPKYFSALNQGNNVRFGTGIRRGVYDVIKGV